MPTLVVEMGHCFRTKGATGTTGEQDYVRRAAAKMVELLHNPNGWQIHKKLADTNDYAGDAFVALHCDGSTNPNAHGASIGYRNRAGQEFGQAVMRAYAARGWPGGFRQDNYTNALKNYYGHGEAIAAGNTKAFVMECGFLTNANDRAELNSPEGLERVALAIGDALGITTMEEDMALTDAQIKMLSEIHYALKGKGEIAETLAQPYVRNNKQWLGDIFVTLGKYLPKLEDSITQAGGLAARLDKIEEQIGELNVLLTQLIAEGVKLGGSGEIVIKPI